jgi:hemolysin activation/secretion protein
LPDTQPSEFPETLPDEGTDKILVKQIEVVGSTVFSPEELAEVTAPFVGKQLSFGELLQVRAAINELYVSKGYIASGAIIPPQVTDDGIIRIQVLEGSLENIQITGNRRLNSNYIRSRLSRAGSKPLNVNQLLEGLQLLKLDPLIENISAELQPGDHPETRILAVEVNEAKSFYVSPSFDNGRVPSVGSFRRQIQLNQASLLGFGDGLNVGYTNTDGSNALDLSYVFPINSRNGTLRFATGLSRNRVIEEPFDVLEIESKSRYYEFTYRQPIVLRPREEFALGLTFSRQESRTELGLDDIGPFPLSVGADEDGSTRVSALRFFQEWTRRSQRSVFAFRSQLSFGIGGLFNASQNEEVPDSNFLVWRGQGQWVQLLAPDTLLLVRGDIQLANRALLPLEQIGIGGPTTVRGYRQEALLADSGALFSTEVRLPILRVPKMNGLLQLAPFVDVGTAWNVSGVNPDPKTLASVGLGLVWQMGNYLTARFDWGIPLVNVDSTRDTLQERGLYFSVVGRF